MKRRTIKIEIEINNLNATWWMSSSKEFIHFIISQNATQYNPNVSVLAYIQEVTEIMIKNNHNHDYRKQGWSGDFNMSNKIR